MNRLGYITNTSLSESSGGGSGVNSASWAGLKENFELEYLYINPPYDLWSKIKSVLLKKLKVKRNYHFFSRRRLNKISKRFDESANNGDAYFFHGFTQWIDTNPQKPYFCFNDACFATYVDIYNNKEEFNTKDLERIYKQEASWLDNAQKVFFRSKWALEETKKAYNLSGYNFVNAGVGGFIDIPEEDEYDGSHNFLFISREFIPKGGKTVVEAFRSVRKTYPDSKLWIVGEDPGDSINQLEGIEYLGFFDKNNKGELQSLLHIFKNAFALVHPTTKDTNTLVINELAYFGCPAIASNKFAIPEYLLDGKTGVLVNAPKDSKELYSKMIFLLKNEDIYNRMRKAARANAIENNTWSKVLERIIKNINEEA